MTDPLKPSNPPSANPTSAPSASAPGTIYLTSAEAKAYIDDHYHRLERMVVSNLLGTYFHIDVSSQHLSVYGFLEALQKKERELRAMKNKDLRNAGLSKRRRTKAETPTAPEPRPPREEAEVIALGRYWYNMVGEPFPQEDRVQWAREQLKDEPDLPKIIRSGLDLE